MCNKNVKNEWKCMGYIKEVNIIYIYIYIRYNMSRDGQQK